MSDVPIFINVRDRVTDLRKLVEWLEQAGYTNLTLLDNASTWPPLLAYLEQSPHTVHRLGQNLGKLALWKADLLPDSEFVLTDPDLLPIEACPPDVVERLLLVMRRHGYVKAGLGLYLNDVRPDLASLGWERELVSPDREIAPGVFDSLVDTTFAVYGRGAPFLMESIRTGYPYQARHLPWYRTELDDEHRYYLEHALHGPEGTSWESQ